MFETFIMVAEDYDDDRIKYNEKFFVDDINDIALRATEKAHFDGLVPVIEFNIKKQDEEKSIMNFEVNIINSEK